MKNSLHYQLFVIALPMILSNITVPLLGLVDTAVIGHLEHAYYLGASTVGATVIASITWLCGFLRMSTTGLAAQAYGEQNSQLGLTVLIRGILVALLISLVVLLCQSLFIPFAIALSGGSAQVQLYATQYAEIRVWGLPAALSNLVLIGWLLGNHHAKAVMWLLIMTNLINLVLDILFVVYLDWQVAGVAMATLIAEYSCLFIGLVIVSNKLSLKVKNFYGQLTHSLINKVVLIDYFKLNRDILIRTLSLQLCFIFITFQGARLGDHVVAANAILMNFLLFISFGLDGIANAAEVMVGKAKGAQNYRRIKQVVTISLWWSFAFASLYSLLFLFAGQSIIMLISDITSVIEYAEQFLIWIVILPLVACWSYLFDGIYIGLTEARIMRNSMLASTFLCFFPVWWSLQSLGNHALWLAFTVFMLARGITLAWHYRTHLAGKAIY
ncbi:MATE family efflux transporter [Thalassotalea sp. G2M2-11]|uniref:MATE family efflux transporter n=1 Tax=Thalassotalea sp. G2M2-11 TaxID=2787627 RepID=UPI001F493164|nr:MATE family efflux transporter [Thalassotalea sp. G2M2-11]